MSLRTFERRLRRALADDELSCILVDIERFEAGWATLKTMHDLLAEARRSGKRVVAHLPEGGGLAEYYVASAANEIWAGPSAALTLNGLSIASTYLATALDRAGLQAQVEAVGRYKTAGEPLVHHEMTAANSEMLNEILDEIERLITDAIQETRTIGPVAARELIGGGPYDALRAQELGLIDDICYPDQLSRKLASGDASKAKATIRRWPAYSRGRHKLGSWPLGRKRLVIYEIHGVLVEGKGPGLKGMVGAKDVVKQLSKLRKDPSVAAVVLALESRGGTVGASDQIRRAVERLGERKPVVAYVGNVAASGGYMVAAAAQQIVAQTASLTGSIGVLAGKVSGQRLLEGLGLHRQVIRRGANSAFASPTEAWSAAERRALRLMIQANYRKFIETVARGRRLPIEQIEQAAEGRVWTGRRALELGLVDRNGDLSDAIALARESSPEAGRALVEPLHPPRPNLPRSIIPLALGASISLALVFEHGGVLALEPFELHVN
jgi:protease-4